MTQRPELVQAWDFTPDHFDRHPVWISCHIVDYDEPWYDDTDEATFRPWTGAIPVGPEEMFVVRASFVLADGTRLDGYLTPTDSAGPRALGTMQPTVFLPGGESCCFWEGIVKGDERAPLYRSLGKTAAEIFPIQAAALKGLAKGITQSTLEGFYSTDDGTSVDVAQ